MTRLASLALVVAAFVITGCGRIGYELIGLAARGGAPAVNGEAGTDGAREGADANGKPDAGERRSEGGVPEAGSGGTGGSGGGTGGAAGSGGNGAPDVGAGGLRDAGPGTGGVSPADSGPGTIRTIDIADPTQTVRSGVAQIGSGELDLTPNTRNVAGAAFLAQPYVVTPTTSFTISFSFRLYGSVGSTGDGFAFLWQNDPRGAAAIGAAGGSLGYGGITPSVIVEFDIITNTYDPANNDVSITTNGQYMTSIADQVPTFAMWDGVTHYAWIDYESASTTLSVYLAQTTPSRPPAPLLSAAVDLYKTVGNTAYLGFTAGTGVANEYAAIESLTVEYRP